MITERAQRLLIPLTGTIQSVMEIIDRGGYGVALGVDDQGVLRGTITDGDVRRGILRGLTLNTPLTELLESRGGSRSISARVGTPPDDLRRLMCEFGVRHIPILDDQERVVDLAFVADFLASEPLPVHAVVMAGGYGHRLRPLTSTVPKPMLPVGGRPLLERTIGRLQRAGIRRCTVTTHYRADIIRDHFGDGHDHGVDLAYIHENAPLGTAGSLRFLENTGSEPLLVVNGDILTAVDFEAMYAFHRDQQADLTLGIRPWECQIPFGVVEINNARVSSIEEKPLLRKFVNGGIYVLEPRVLERIPAEGPCHMTDLVERVISDGGVVAAFPITEYWQDIGNPEDYQKADGDVRDGRWIAAHGSSATSRPPGAVNGSFVP